MKDRNDKNWVTAVDEAGYCAYAVKHGGVVTLVTFDPKEFPKGTGPNVAAVTIVEEETLTGHDRPKYLVAGVAAKQLLDCDSPNDGQQDDPQKLARLLYRQYESRGIPQQEWDKKANTVINAAVGDVVTELSEPSMRARMENCADYFYTNRPTLKGPEAMDMLRQFFPSEATEPVTDIDGDA